MTTVDLNATAGRRFPAGRVTRHIVGGLSPLQSAHFALGLVTLDPDGGQVPWHNQDQDEAYFVLWGRSPDLGFYDHPPMIGWLLAPLVALSNADWVARLPVTVVPALTALMVRHALERAEGRVEEAARLLGISRKGLFLKRRRLGVQRMRPS